MTACDPCGRPADNICDGCRTGNPPPERLAVTAREREGRGCARGCMLYRRHLQDCPVEDHKATAWVPWRPGDDLPPGLGVTPDQFRADLLEQMSDADWRDHTDTAVDIQAIARSVHIGRYGGLETRRDCGGCKPRDARHGSICEPCHLRLTEWVKGQHNLAWAYDWLAADREPRQNTGMGDIITGSKVPPAALNIGVTDLRDEIRAWLAKWIGRVVTEHNLTGPAWWRKRVDEAARRRHNGEENDADWRAPLPQGVKENWQALHFIAGWLERIEDDPDMAAPMWDEAHNLMVKVAAIAPWRAEPRKLRGVPCPECERDALAIYEGDSSVTCRRCRAVYGRERYDVWSRMLEHERGRKAS